MSLSLVDAAGNLRDVNARLTAAKEALRALDIQYRGKQEEINKLQEQLQEAHQALADSALADTVVIL